MKSFIIVSLFFLAILLTLSCSGQHTETVAEEVPIFLDQSPKIYTRDGEEVFRFVEQMPRFPACENVSHDKIKKCSKEQMNNFIYSDLKYPAEAGCIVGTVVVKFIVRKDGSLTDFKCTRDIGGGCGEEALRVLRKMPNWIPGSQRGRPVDVQYSLPINFRLH